jgi:hypothetical protein
MRRLISQALIIVLVAVSFASGADCASSAAHKMVSATSVAEHAIGVAHDLADGGVATHPDQSGTDHDPDGTCAQLHAHCCLFVGILGTPTAVAGRTDPRLHFERNALVPYGQLSRPPHRPPRVAA